VEALKVMTLLAEEGCTDGVSQMLEAPQQDGRDEEVATIFA